MRSTRSWERISVRTPASWSSADLEGDETLGLESGDVILRIGNREVKNPEHVVRILRSCEPDEELSVDIVRHGWSETLKGTVPEASFRFGYTFRASEKEDE